MFDKVIDLLIQFDCLDTTAIYIDSTNTKAYANKKKNHKEMVKIEAKKYQKELELEIALKGLHDKDLTEEEYFEEVNTEEVIGEKEIIVSNIDPDAGILYKNDKEKMFAYNTSVICDNFGIISIFYFFYIYIFFNIIDFFVSFI